MTRALLGLARVFRWCLICSLLLTASANAASEARASFSLDGRWQFTEGSLRATDGYLDATKIVGWRSMHVPANWFNEGLDYSGSAWYRRSVTKAAVKRFQETNNNNQAIAFVRFGAVDYAADVWFNESHVGFHEGYFSPFELDVTDHWESKGPQRLAVRVDSPEEQSGPSWGLHKRLIKGVLSHHDTRPGGAWSHRGQEKNTGGIWDSVSLELARGVFLGEVKVGSNLAFAPDTSLLDASITLDIEAQRWRGAKSASLRMRLYRSGSEIVLDEVDLGAISPRQGSVRKTVSIDSPKLWWPRGRGEQNLYDAEIVALNSAGEVMHARKIRFGLRSVERDRETGEWLVNGRRLFLKGTNYIATQWKSNFTKIDYERDLRLMQAANINAVRVHAQVESTRFYEAADELGMLVWQDFPLQWGYEDSAELLSSASHQLIEMIDLLDKHPSVIAWSIHNEPPWDADWMKWKYADYDAAQNRKLDDQLYKLAKRRDDSRYVHKVSRTKEHQWFGWYSGSIDTFAKAPPESLVSEFGAQALPVMSSLEKIISGEHLWPTTDKAWAEWGYKNFQHKETFELAKVAKPTSTQNFIDLTQSYQADLISFAGAAYRSRQYQPLSAMFQFMFVEDWPSINWGVVDWYRYPKPGYQALKTIYSPVLAVPVLTGTTGPVKPLTIPIRLVNDRWRDVDSVQIEVGLFSLAGELVAGSAKQFSGSAPQDSLAEVAQWRVSPATGEYRLRVTTQETGAEPVVLDLPFTVTRNDASE